jgi:hypothetical protein
MISTYYLKISNCISHSFPPHSTLQPAHGINSSQPSHEGILKVTPSRALYFIHQGSVISLEILTSDVHGFGLIHPSQETGYAIVIGSHTRESLAKSIITVGGWGEERIDAYNYMP